MKITGIELINVRGFKHLEKTELSKTINIFVGPNNSGKSTIINSIYLLQNSSVLNKKDITIGAQNGEIRIYVKGDYPPVIKLDSHFQYILKMLTGGNLQINRGQQGNQGLEQIPTREPKNLIYPYLSKRKVVNFDNTINETNQKAVTGNFQNLYSKIDRLITPQYQPGNAQYIKACNDILGFEISTLAIGGGKEAVYYIDGNEYIPLTAMGEGVVNILGLITDLCVAEQTIFLIEEPENDIHPIALKSLLDLIIEKSKTNQFFISTHSNIVMKHLGAVEQTKVFSVTNVQHDEKRPKLFLSEMKEVSKNPNERRKILEDLGYDLFDFDLWKGWLFLEESSAEALIRDYFIKWYVPQLKYKLRTFSAGSCSNVEPKFEDFNRLFVFLHLEPAYKNKVWVYIDSGDEESRIIGEMKEKYSVSGWSEEQFGQFSQHDFEKYYPDKFQQEVDQVLAVTGKQKKRIKKAELLEKVKAWIDDNPTDAKTAFKESASEIIEILRMINRNLS